MINDEIIAESRIDFKRILSSGVFILFLLTLLGAFFLVAQYAKTFWTLFSITLSVIMSINIIHYAECIFMTLNTKVKVTKNGFIILKNNKVKKVISNDDIRINEYFLIGLCAKNKSNSDKSTYLGFIDIEDINKKLKESDTAINYKIEPCDKKFAYFIAIIYLILSVISIYEAVSSI